MIGATIAFNIITFIVVFVATTIALLALFMIVVSIAWLLANETIMFVRKQLNDN